MGELEHFAHRDRHGRPGPTLANVAVPVVATPRKAANAARIRERVIVESITVGPVLTNEAESPPRCGTMPESIPPRVHHSVY